MNCRPLGFFPVLLLVTLIQVQSGYAQSADKAALRLLPADMYRLSTSGDSGRPTIFAGSRREGTAADSKPLEALRIPPSRVETEADKNSPARSDAIAPSELSAPWLLAAAELAKVPVSSSLVASELMT